MSISTLALSPLAVSINTRLYSLYHHQCISPSPSPASSSSSPQSPPLSSYYPAAHFSGDWVFIREVFVYHSRKTLQLIEDFEPFIEERFRQGSQILNIMHSDKLQWPNVMTWIEVI
ncbi:hypothetical protein YC2023_059735 [Brassica napus]